MVLGQGNVVGWVRDESPTMMSSPLQHAGWLLETNAVAEKLRAQMKDPDNKHFTADPTPPQT